MPDEAASYSYLHAGEDVCQHVVPPVNMDNLQVGSLQEYTSVNQTVLSLLCVSENASTTKGKLEKPTVSSMEQIQHRSEITSQQPVDAPRCQVAVVGPHE